MTVFQILAILLTLTAAFAWLNERTLRLPPTIGVMLAALGFSLVLLVADRLGLDLDAWAVRLLESIQFDDALLDGVLSFLLFAGALHLSLEDLSRERSVIGILATVGLLISTAVVGFGLHAVLGWLGVSLDLAWCLVFGALISPTDPVAVLGIMRQVRAPHALETRIAGESLFNDGVAVVTFLALLGLVGHGHETGFAGTVRLLVVEVAGGAVFGLGTGWICYQMLKQVDHYQVEILATLALVTGGYALAHALHVSAPIATVVAGLFIGNHGRVFAMSDTTRARLDEFWELVDEILNAVLFVVIGLEVLVLPIPHAAIPLGAVVVAVVLLARFIGVSAPMALLRLRRPLEPGSIRLMTWAGLRGGISVAMALSLPAGPERDLIVGLTYAVVVFSVIVQGLTVAPLVARLFPREDATMAPL